MAFFIRLHHFWSTVLLRWASAMCNCVLWEMKVVRGVWEEVIESQEHVPYSEKDDSMQDVQFPSAP